MTKALSKKHGCILLNLHAAKVGLKVEDVKGFYNILWRGYLLKQVRSHDDGLLFFEAWELGRKSVGLERLHGVS